MKKKRWLFFLFSIMMVAVWGTRSLETNAASKAETKKKVYKVITSVKSGKYTYYTDGKTIYRENSKGKKTKLSKYPADGDFIISGNYIYYHSETKNKIYRMTKAGKSQKKYNVSASKIRMIKDGYIYYNNSVGLNRIKTSGDTKTKVKLLSYPNNYNSVIVGSRIYYSRWKGVDNKDGSRTYTAYIQSVNLKGKNKKTHATFAGSMDVEIAGDGRYLYSSAKVENGYELGVIDTKAAEASYTKLQFNEVIVDESEFIDEVERYVPLVVIDGTLYFQNDDYLYSMTSSGGVTKLLKMPTDNVQGVKIEKQSNYYWLEFYGDDTFSLNYIYNKNWKLVKKLTQKYGNATDLKIKSKKIYVVFNKSEDRRDEEKFKTYKILDLKN